MSRYSWTPIEPLSQPEKSIDLAGIGSLYDAWRGSMDRAMLKPFNERLVRRLSIETGILEHLYNLDRGTTEALIAHGFVEDLVSRADTNIEPSRLIGILRDQEAAIQLVIDCISNHRPLTRGLIHQLHAILTGHRDSTMAVDRFGNRLEIPLLKGKYKEQPNNPKRPDGSMHEYCPPIHVEAEMDKLLTWLSTYSNADPIIVSAWLHHRFTRIHPYQDGNGRVSRVLTTLVLLKVGLLPLVIDRDMRVEYIDSLETADGGDLDVETPDKNQTSAVIESLSEKLGKRRQFKPGELRKVDMIALALREQALTALSGMLNQVKDTLTQIGDPDVELIQGGPDTTETQRYKRDVIEAARQKDTFANFAENHYFIRASIRVNGDRLVFVTSFHHVGRALTGIMEATAFSSDDFSICSKDPFVFTYKTHAPEILESFGRWLDGAFAIALKEYSDRL